MYSIACGTSQTSSGVLVSAGICEELERTITVDHEDTTCWTSILVCDGLWINLFVFRHICWVIDYGADEETTT